MDLNTVQEIVRPAGRETLPCWRPGDAWLAGGTWLFSEPQPHLSRLIDLDRLSWPPLTVDEAGIEIAATCRIADLYAFQPRSDWPGTRLFRPCCDALLASFKIWNMATVGGNLCLALPAGAMITLAVALDAVCTIWLPDGNERHLPARDFVTDNGRNALAKGELLRAITLPAATLARRAALRQANRSRHGRSVALLAATRGADDRTFAVTVTAATRRPVRVDVPGLPRPDVLAAAIEAAIPDALYFDDPHGSAGYRRRMTRHLALDLLAELAEP